MDLDLKTNVLSNGIKLITAKKNTSLFSLQIGVKTGSLYERSGEKGYAHFIEHMLFKGTESRTNESINEKLEFIGGDSNAYTDYTYTIYSISALSEDIEDALSLFSDMLMNSSFNENEIAKEKGVVLSEIRAVAEDIEDLSFAQINKFSFAKSSLRYDILGLEKAITNIEREKVYKFYKKYYIPDNTVISITSPYSNEYLLNMVNKYFSNWERGKLYKKTFIYEKNKNIRKVIKKDYVEQCSIIYLYTFNDFSEEEEMALKVLNYKLSDSTNSILFKRLREDTGLVYDVYTHVDTLKNVKTFYIYTEVSRDKIEEAEKIINDSIEDILNRKIKFDEGTIFSMEKNLKNALANTLEDTEATSNYFLYKVIEDEKIESFREEIEKYSNIKSDDVYNAADKLFSCKSELIIIPR